MRACHSLKTSKRIQNNDNDSDVNKTNRKQNNAVTTGVCHNNVKASDVSFTPERIRGSGSSKGTTGSYSDQKERNRGIGFVNRNWIHSDSADLELLIPIQNH
ncbi:hypothetical protein AVEN_78273-1 [Araneus ventricosus]|uniref:Uncharacterized protein n=1 Tax=Araneus ventricosus TaxID=182803 RepID=A0A4Y2QA91_ARAVE|nr:hypothetical protein AVEN_78273-1 [Araneus ventricosus]